MRGKRKGIEEWLREYFLLREELELVIQRKNDCVKEGRFEFAVALRDKEKKLWRKHKSLVAKIKANL